MAASAVLGIRFVACMPALFMNRTGPVASVLSCRPAFSLFPAAMDATGARQVTGVSHGKTLGAARLSSFDGFLQFQPSRTVMNSVQAHSEFLEYGEVQVGERRAPLDR